MHERRRWTALLAGLTVACFPLLVGSCSTSKYVVNEPAEESPETAAAEAPQAEDAAAGGEIVEQAPPPPLPGTNEYTAERIRDIEGGLNPLNSVPAAKTSSPAGGDAKTSPLVSEKNEKK